MRPASPRLRLPRGFRQLSDDYGGILRERRRERNETQADVAERAGMARETLSRIERGNRPAYAATLDELLAALELDWDAIAVRGPTERIARVFHDTFESDAVSELGRSLRAGRRACSMSLHVAAERSGVSAAQLSRIERGEIVRSRSFTYHPDDGRMPADQRRVIFSDQFLADLAMEGGLR